MRQLALQKHFSLPRAAIWVMSCCFFFFSLSFWVGEGISTSFCLSRKVLEMYSDTWLPERLISDRCVSSRFSILLNCRGGRAQTKTAFLWNPFPNPRSVRAGDSPSEQNSGDIRDGVSGRWFHFHPAQHHHDWIFLFSPRDWFPLKMLINCRWHKRGENVSDECLWKLRFLPQVEIPHPQTFFCSGFSKVAPFCMIQTHSCTSRGEISPKSEDHIAKCGIRALFP